MDRILLAIAVGVCLLGLSDATCERPQFENGYTLPDYRRKPYSNGEQIRFECFLGHRRTGPKYSRCKPDGTWTELPVCFNPQVFCKNEEAEIKNGLALNGPIQGRFYDGVSVWYICNYGYKLPTSKHYKNTCKKGKWTYVKPICKEIDYRPLKKYWERLSLEERVTLYTIYGKKK